MKAIIQNRYGSPEVLQLGEIAEPVAADDQLLVRVHATSIHADVWHMMRGLPYVMRFMGAGVRRAKDVVPGTELRARRIRCHLGLIGRVRDGLGDRGVTCLRALAFDPTTKQNDRSRQRALR